MKIFNKKSKHTLGSILRSVCDACDSIITLYSSKRKEYVESYLIENGDGTFSPKKIKIKNGFQEREFSELGLYYNNAPEPDTITVRTKISLTGLEAATIKDQSGSEVSVSNTKCELSNVKVNNACEVEMTFKVREDDEHIRRMLEFLN